MNSKRFKHLRDYIGYDNERLAKMLNLDVAEGEDYCCGRIPIPDTVAAKRELFADWSSEVGDTSIKRQLAKKHFGES
jgi:hypothetical protein